ncbi:7,8-dihydro-8-oxoguanine-triphosphatase [Vibrio breoganii]|uniref:8-oxo-dGTP diphosphatase MutT n=1 Tax=Vibrio breoganii TaxID=553239 RepID=UPI000C8358D0|nr:8-oxo-dGTP diphosphatase MutT [Vibrio breoganii]PML08938.1 7,8-dihydro-8-oxoguanine-triphosphatase [Vibrio breoganii]
MKRVHIVAGIIFNPEKTQVYITKRPDNAHKGGFWEFPGGKVEDNESVSDAIERELFEEIGIQGLHSESFQHFDFDYTDKSLSFDFLLIHSFEGKPYGKEGQLGQWVAVPDLANYTFPEANVPVVQAVIQHFCDEM